MNPKPSINQITSTGIIIPAYNVDSHLQIVLEETLQYIRTNRIWVVDDGSTDRSRKIAQQMGVNVIVHEKNQGKGAALKSAFKAVLQTDCEFLITMDGDGQHATHCIPEFIQMQQEQQSDIVLGCRNLHPSVMPLDRILSNRLSSLIISMICKVWVPDSQCGFRMFKTDIFSQIILSTTHYETETEILFKTLNRNWKVSFCTIPTLYNSKISYINRFIDSLRFCKLLLRKLLNQI